MADTLYRVAWKWKTAKQHAVRDYSAPDLKTLMKMLKRSENVSPDTVAELVIHQINSDNTITEMFATCEVPWKEDGTPEKVTPAEEVVTTNLERIRQAILANRNGGSTAAAKPRIRLVHSQEPEKHYAANGLYYAVAAT